MRWPCQELFDDPGANPQSFIQINSGGKFEIDVHQTHYIDIDFINYGQVNVLDGNLLFEGPSLQAGNITVAQGSELKFDGDPYDITFDSTITGNSSITGTGLTSFSDTFRILGSLSVNTQAKQGNQVIVEGPGLLQINGDYTIEATNIANASGFSNGGVTVGAPQNNAAKLIFHDPGVNPPQFGATIHVDTSIVNHGVIEWKDIPIRVFANGSFENKLGASFLIQDDKRMSRPEGNGKITNSGTIQKTNGTGTSTIELEVENTQSGRIRQSLQGKLEVNGKLTLFDGELEGDGIELSGGLDQFGGFVSVGGNLDIIGQYALFGGVLALEGGVLTATTLDIDYSAELMGFGSILADVTNNGTLFVGDIFDGVTRTEATGILSIAGDYTQGALGVIDFDIAGVSDFDQLNITGQANLGGTLAVDLLFGYEPNVGDSFDLLTWVSWNGQEFVEDLQDPINGDWDSQYLDDPSGQKLTLSVI